MFERMSVAVIVMCGCAPARAELIDWSDAGLEVLPGASATSLALLGESVTPLFGYSLDLEIVALAGSTGTISIDTAATNFFLARNLIAAGGAALDPVFSVIQPAMNGAFISANTADLSTVTATPGVNDVLAQLFFAASSDASGDFEVRVGGGTALSDGNGFPVAFESRSLPIRVIPAPASLALLVGGLMAIGRRRGAEDLKGAEDARRA